MQFSFETRRHTLRKTTRQKSVKANHGSRSCYQSRSTPIDIGIEMIRLYLYKLHWHHKDQNCIHLGLKRKDKKRKKKEKKNIIKQGRVLDFAGLQLFGSASCDFFFVVSFVSDWYLLSSLFKVDWIFQAADVLRKVFQVWRTDRPMSRFGAKDWNTRH